MPLMEISARELERLQIKLRRLKKSTYVLNTSSEDANRVNSCVGLLRLKCHVYQV